jgi:hypothetical protein
MRYTKACVQGGAASPGTAFQTPANDQRVQTASTKPCSTDSRGIAGARRDNKFREARVISPVGRVLLRTHRADHRLVCHVRPDRRMFLFA